MSGGRRDDDPAERGPGGGEASGSGGVSYTGRPSGEEPEEGGATRDESAEREDHPEGRERT